LRNKYNYLYAILQLIFLRIGIKYCGIKYLETVHRGFAVVMLNYTIEFDITLINSIFRTTNIEKFVLRQSSRFHRRG